MKNNLNNTTGVKKIQCNKINIRTKNVHDTKEDRIQNTLQYNSIHVDTI